MDGKNKKRSDKEYAMSSGSEASADEAFSETSDGWDEAMVELEAKCRKRTNHAHKLFAKNCSISSTPVKKLKSAIAQAVKGKKMISSTPMDNCNHQKKILCAIKDNIADLSSIIPNESIATKKNIPNRSDSIVNVSSLVSPLIENNNDNNNISKTTSTNKGKKQKKTNLKLTVKAPLISSQTKSDNITNIMKLNQAKSQNLNNIVMNLNNNPEFKIRSLKSSNENVEASSPASVEIKQHTKNKQKNQTTKALKMKILKRLGSPIEDISSSNLGISGFIYMEQKRNTTKEDEEILTQHEPMVVGVDEEDTNVAASSKTVHNYEENSQQANLNRRSLRTRKNKEEDVDLAHKQLPALSVSKFPKNVPKRKRITTNKKLRSNESSGQSTRSGSGTDASLRRSTRTKRVPIKLYRDLCVMAVSSPTELKSLERLTRYGNIKK